MKKSLIFIFLVLLSSLAYASSDDFDCNTLGISVNNCYTQNGIFKAELTILGTRAPGSYNKILDSIKGVDYILDTTTQYKTINGDLVARGTLPEGYKITSIGLDKFLLEADMGDNIVKSLRAQYSKNHEKNPYNYEMDKCYIEASRLNVKMYGFKMCELLKTTAVVEENQITAEVVKEVEKPQESTIKTMYYVLGGILLLVGIIILIFVLKRK